MSRSIKRACAGLSAAALTLSLLGGLGAASTAYGATVETAGDGLTCPSDNGTKIVLNFAREGVTGRTFQAYKIANLEADASGQAVSYTVTGVDGVDAAVKSAVQEAGVTTKATGAESVAALTSDDWKTATSSDIRKVATALDKAKGSLGSPVDIDGTSSGDTKGLTPGIYLVVETTAATSSTNPSVSIPMIISTKYVQDSEGTYCYVGTSEVKNNDVTITKTVTEGTDPSAFNGQEVSFTLTVPVPSRTGYDAGSFIFYVADQLPEGLSYKTGSARFNGGSVEIKPATVNGKLVWNFSDRTIKNGETIDGLAFDKDVSSFNTLLNTSSKPSTITITYQATISDGSTFVDGNTGNTNTASVTYTNGPDSYFHGEDTAKTYQGQFTINKKDSSGATLKGATFRITSGSDYDKTVLDATSGTGADGAADGALTFSDLKATEQGVTYTVSETAAPSGYAKISDFTVTVKLVDDGHGGKKITYETDDAPSGVSLTTTEDTGAANVTDLTTVQNLAHTGGQVAGILALAGVLAGSGVVIGRMRRRVEA